MFLFVSSSPNHIEVKHGLNNRKLQTFLPFFFNDDIFQPFVMFCFRSVFLKLQFRLRWLRYMNFFWSPKTFAILARSMQGTNYPLSVAVAVYYYSLPLVFMVDIQYMSLLCTIYICNLKLLVIIPLYSQQAMHLLLL